MKAEVKKALQYLNAGGDDRDLSTHGADGGYWYSIRDGMALLVAIRVAKLSYNQAAYTEYTENKEGIFLADPYHELNFEESLLGDIERLMGGHGAQTWVKKPNIIVIPVLSGLHWRCIRIEINYNVNQVSILFDDPYGKGRFDEKLKGKIRSSMQKHLPKLFLIEANKIGYDEVEKEVNQQGGDNSVDCGPVVFGNVEDYCNTSKSNKDFVTKEGFTVVTEAGDPGHSKDIEGLRVRHIKEFNKVSRTTVNDNRLNSIREAISQSNNDRKLSYEKKANISSSDAETMGKMETLPAEYVSHIFNAMDLGIALRDAYESIVAENQLNKAQADVVPSLKESKSDKKIHPLLIEKKKKLQEALELPLIEDKECLEDLRSVFCGSDKKGIKALVKKYKDEEESPILVIALQMLNQEDINDYKALVECITKLFKKYASRKYKDQKGNTIAHYIVRYLNNATNLNEFLPFGGLYESTNNYGATFLHTAVFYDRIGACESLLPALISFTKKTLGLTALDVAVALNKTREIRQLVRLIGGNMGFNASFCNSNILKLAVDYNSLASLEYLLKYYAMDYSMIQEALIYSCIVNNRGNEGAIDIFVKNGGNLREKSQATGNTAIHEVVLSEMEEGRKIKVVDLLLKHDKDLITVHNAAYECPHAVAKDRDIQLWLLTKINDRNREDHLRFEEVTFTQTSIIFKDHEIVEGCKLLIERCSSLKPEEERVYGLSILHNIQKHYNVLELIEDVNRLFVECAQYIKVDPNMKQKQLDYNTIGQGLILDRLEFLQKFLKKDKQIEQTNIILNALKDNKKPETNYDWFLLKFSGLWQSQGLQIIDKERDQILSMLRINIGMYNDGINEYASVLLKDKNYLKAAMCYDALRQNSTGEMQEKAQIGLYRAEAELILSVPSSSAHSALNNQDIKALREAGRLFLLCERYDNAITILRHVLISVQEKLRIDTANIEQKSIERSTFIEYAYACAQKIKIAHDIDIKRKDLNDKYNELPKMPMAHKKWNGYLITNMKNLVKEACDQLGNKFGCAVLGIGDIAGGAAPLYPEIRMIIITEQAINSTIKPYFTALIDLIKIKIISLGGMQALPQELTRNNEWQNAVKGIKYGYKLPNISNDKCIRIGTAQEVLDEIYENEFLEDIVLLNGSIEGKKVYRNFLDAKKGTHTDKGGQFLCFKALRVYTDLKLENLDEDIKLEDAKEAIKVSNLIISGLFSYYDLIPLDPNLQVDKLVEAKIDELVKAGKGITLSKPEDWGRFPLYYFEDETAKGLKKWFKFGYEMLIKTECGRSIVLENREKFNGMLATIIRPLLKITSLWLSMLSESEQVVPKTLLRSEIRKKIITLKSPTEIAKILLLESKELMSKYQGTKNISYSEQANWYFEKALELDLNLVEKDWLESIALLSRQEISANKLTYYDGEGKCREIFLSQEQLDKIKTLDKAESTTVLETVKEAGYFDIKFSDYPGISYALSSLSHHLLGYMATQFCTLARLSTSDGKVKSALISRHVIGENCKLDKIGNIAYGINIIRSVISVPESNKPEDFRVQNILSPTGVKEERLICINNGVGLMKMDGRTGLYRFSGNRCISKSILYCNNKMLDEAVAEVLCKKLKGLKSEMIKSWLERLVNIDSYNQALFPEAREHVQIKLYKATGIAIYYKLLKLQDIVNTQKYRDLLSDVDNITYEIYKKHLSDEKAPQEVFDIVVREQEDLIKKASKGLHNTESTLSPKYALDKLDSLSKHINTLRQIYSSPTENTLDPSLPLELREILINGGGTAVGSSIFAENIFQSIARQCDYQIEIIENKQRHVLKNMKKQGVMPSTWFTRNFKKLNLRGCIAIKNEDLYYILPKDATCLDISNCTNLDLNVLNLIALYHPEIKDLHLSSDIKPSELFPKSRLNKVTSLFITGCSELNDKIKSILDSCPAVENIYLLDQEEVLCFEITDEKALTPLMWAAQTGKEQILKALLNGKKADIGAKDKMEYTALHHAAVNNKVGVVELLLNEHADLEAINSAGETPLISAVAQGQMQSVLLLLSKGAQINATDRSLSTGLHHAAFRGYVEIANLLCENGADLHAINQTGETPLMRAAVNGKLECFKALLEQGANLAVKDIGENTVLHRAAMDKNSNLGLIEYICARGVRQLANINGDTPLTIAAKGKFEERVKFFLSRLLSTTSPFTLNHDPNTNLIEITKLLCRDGADLEAKDIIIGNTFLLWAICNNEDVLVKFVLSKGAEVKACDSFGNTVLHLAAISKSPALFQILYEKCEKSAPEAIAAINQRGENILMSAISGMNYTAVNLLLQKKLDVKAKDNRGNTILHFVACSGLDNLELFKTLCYLGADPSIANNGGATPRVLAEQSNKTRIADFLRNSEDEIRGLWGGR